MLILLITTYFIIGSFYSLNYYLFEKELHEYLVTELVLRFLFWSVDLFILLMLDLVNNISL